MNQTFSWSRFGRLTRTYFLDNRGTLLVNVALLVGGLTVLSLFVYSQYPYAADDTRYPLFLIVGWAAGYVFTVQQVAALNEKERAITYLLRPASLLEKYLLIVLTSGLGFLLLYLPLITAIDAVGVSYVNHRNWTSEQLAQIQRVLQQVGGEITIKSYYDSAKSERLPTLVWVFSLFIHPVALAFALFIRRYALPLIVVVVVGLLALGLVVNSYVLNGLFGRAEDWSGLPFSSIGITRDNAFRRVLLPQPIGSQIQYLIGVTLLVLLYITAYFGLKEREV